MTPSGLQHCSPASSAWSSHWRSTFFKPALLLHHTPVTFAVRPDCDLLRPCHPKVTTYRPTFSPMISWIQKYFQHHFRTIFAVMLGLLIISFVFTIGPSGLGRGNSLREVRRTFFDYNLSSQEDQRRLMGDASLSAGLELGSLSGMNGSQVQSYALQRAASLHLADELHLPKATRSEIEEYIKNLRP